MDATVVVGLLSVSVAAAAVLVARDNARRQELGLDQWLRDLRAWASEAIDVLSEAIYAWNETEGISANDKSRFIYRLSALIDSGRFFLPNVANEPINEDKTDALPAAYQGYRHTALDPLVAAIDVIEHARPGAREVLWELRREFVSIIYLILDPAQHNRRISKRIRSSRQRVSALLPNVPPGQNAVLRRVEERINKNSLKANYDE
jgi:hypothetical protein